MAFGTDLPLTVIRMTGSPIKVKARANSGPTIATFGIDISDSGCGITFQNVVPPVWTHPHDGKPTHVIALLKTSIAWDTHVWIKVNSTDHLIGTIAASATRGDWDWDPTIETPAGTIIAPHFVITGLGGEALGTVEVIYG